jgi:hypothetical protein
MLSPAVEGAEAVFRAGETSIMTDEVIAVM